MKSLRKLFGLIWPIRTRWKLDQAIFTGRVKEVRSSTVTRQHPAESHHVVVFQATDVGGRRYRIQESVPTTYFGPPQGYYEFGRLTGAVHGNIESRLIAVRNFARFRAYSPELICRNHWDPIFYPSRKPKTLPRSDMPNAMTHLAAVERLTSNSFRIRYLDDGEVKHSGLFANQFEGRMEIIHLLCEGKILGEAVWLRAKLKWASVPNTPRQDMLQQARPVTKAGYDELRVRPTDRSHD